MKTVAIVQSCYIPWKGYFDIIRRVDELILFDDAQYTRHDWRNRNKIKTPDGAPWITIPVRYDGDEPPPIYRAEIADPRWATKHPKTLRQYYSKARCFAEVFEDVESLYRSCAAENRLSPVNRAFLELICKWLDIDTAITWSMQYQFEGGKTARLVDLCRRSGAGRYLSGPSARDYLDEAQFEAAGIELEYMSYVGYPEYPQLHGEFVHEVSALDLLFNCGDQARRFLLP